MHKTIFHIDFFLLPSGSPHGYARLETNLKFTPSLEIMIEHPVWKEAREPISISYNINDSSFYINLKQEEIESEDSLIKNKEMYKLHGWSIS